jgi:hypothetical protein
MPILTYVDDFLHHPTFPREATRGDFFSLMPQSRAFTVHVAKKLHMWS